MKGKCNCGKPATSEYLIRNAKSMTTVKFCDKCKPKLYYDNITLIDGK